MLCRVHAPLSCKRLSDRTFRATAESAQFDQVGLTRVHSVEQELAWSPDRPSPHAGALLVTLQTIGTGVLVQDGIESRLEPGCLAFHESVRPFIWIFPGEFEQLVIRLPRQTVVPRFGIARRWTARMMSGSSGIGSIVSGFLRQTFSSLSDCAPATAYRLSQISHDLIDTALGELSGEESANFGRTALLYRAKQMIEAHLHDPELSPAKVAIMLRISLRYLQDLFANEKSTPSTWIWERRLGRCHTMLADPMFARTSITDIAFGCGFSDYSHFNHRFRAAFSLSPSEYRDVTRKEFAQKAK